MRNIKRFWATNLLLLTFVCALAQEIKPYDQCSEKIKGSRFIAYPTYPGKPFLNDKFMMGEIEFNDGSKANKIGLNYGAYRDELIYYNPSISAQIVIDKKSIKGFSVTDKAGILRTFVRLFYPGYLHDDCYFEVLSQGKIMLLAFRKVDLERMDAYFSKTGMAYQPAYSYYLYSPGKGFASVKLSKSSLLARFDKAEQKVVRKILRRSGIYVSDETSLIAAWNLLSEKELHVIF
ncbi:MAG: hypothetical protein LWW85_07095 [Marinilabiliales bacterium]|nr:hypothetical protein [Marinilabiliales bacterium]